MRALAAMSGGVDSSVAAALMLRRGWEVIGVTMKMWQGPNGEAPVAGCCTVSDAEDARRVAARLDIPYYVWDYTEEFMGGVVERFIGDYVSGRTPNPCVECNRTVKFSRLLERAAEVECEVVVTGHYARNLADGGRRRLLRGADPDKDQSYVLSMLGQSELRRVRFPVGGMTKAQTRRVAADLGIRTAAKPDSQDICFVGQGDYRRFLAERGAVSRPGPIVDYDGTELGEHEGVAGFTIGQRRGLGVSVGEARYVTAIDPEAAVVTLGRRRHLQVEEMTIREVSWVDAPAPGPALVQYRAHGEAHPARLRESEGGEWRALLERPVRGVAPGQTAAFYHGEEVVGGGIIAAAGPDPAPRAVR